MQQYYVAVGSVQGKAATLLDLLTAVITETDRALTIGVCCSARDTCDAIVAALVKDGTCRVTCWHADMTAAELAQTGRMIQERNVMALADTAAFSAPDATPEDARFVHPDDARAQEQFELEGVASSGRGACAAAARQAANVLVATDAALKAAPEGATPLNAQLLINYDLPTNKERHSRRMAAVLGGDGGAARTAAIHFVVAGQIAQFRALEKFTHAAIFEMPVHAAEVLI